MKALSFLSLVLCTAGLTHLGYAADPGKFALPDPVAVVEGKEIKAAEVQKALDSMIQRAGKQASDITDDQKLGAARQIVNELIIQQLVTNRSAGVKIDDAEVDASYQQFASQPQFQEQLKANNLTPEKAKQQIREMLRSRKWMASQVPAKPVVTDADAKAFYDAHPTSFDAPETVRASHIFIKVPEDAKPDVVAEKQKAIDAAAARVAKGEDFAKVASDVSEDPQSKAKGGDLGFFGKASMLPEIADAAFALKKDEVSKVVKSKAGFHIVKATDRKEAHKVTLDEAKPKLMAFLEQQKQREVTMQFLNDLKAKADVKINLPPEPVSMPMGMPGMNSTAPAQAPQKPAKSAN